MMLKSDWSPPERVSMIPQQTHQECPCQRAEHHHMLSISILRLIHNRHSKANISSRPGALSKPTSWLVRGPLGFVSVQAIVKPPPPSLTTSDQRPPRTWPPPWSSLSLSSKLRRALLRDPHAARRIRKLKCLLRPHVLVASNSLSSSPFPTPSDAVVRYLISKRHAATRLACSCDAAILLYTFQSFPYPAHHHPSAPSDEIQTSNLIIHKRRARLARLLDSSG